MRFLLSITFILSIITLSAQEFKSKEDSLKYYNEFIPETHYEEIEDRMSCLSTTIPLNFNDRVRSFIDYFVIRNRAYTRGILKRKSYYFPIFEEILKKYDLPDELKYLSIIESGLNPNAISWASAAGLWQFIPSTGRLYGLDKDWYIDERMDPYKSTEAACKYLKSLYRSFGDWELALAAYNSGPGKVRRAIRRSGYKKSFWEIYWYLPRETRSYVPQFVAMIYVLNYADYHNFYGVDEEFMMDTDTINIKNYFHLETFTNQINICEEDILKLNPEIKRGALPDEIIDYSLIIPADKKDYIVSNRKLLYDSASKVGKKTLEYLARNMPGSTYGRTKIKYKVRSGDFLGRIARNYHVRISDLKSWNNLRSNLIRVGQYLDVWVLPQYSAKTKKLYQSTSGKLSGNALAHASGSKSYEVKYGDTLWDISRKYSTLSPEELKTLNNLKSNKIKPGQKLLLSK
ncbi:MAG TPA: transglycosylase SLT domain-containing protein [Cyclobacteriaceae bacterium]